MFSIIPAFKSVGDQFQALIFSHLLPSNEGLIIKYLNNFTLQARKLTAFGVMFLMVSAYFMLKNIEKNFNDIWSVPHERRGVANFLLYWAILSLGPLLIGLAVLMNTYLMSLRIFVDHYDSYNLIDQVFEWMPWLLTSAAFTLLYIAVPNCKVPVGHAVLGGVLTLLVFELVKKGFSLMVSHSSLNFIYGAFAVVPLFLLWLNLSWMIILGGAVFVRSIGLHQIHLKDRHYPDLFGCLLVLWQFHVASFKGDSVRNTQLLHLGLSTTQWQRIREMLLNNKIITSNQQNEYVLCRDLARLHISELNEWLGVGHRLPDDQSALADLPWLAHAQYHLGGMDQLEGERLGLSVEDFFDTSPVKPVS
jgi:membrane protein